MFERDRPVTQATYLAQKEFDRFDRTRARVTAPAGQDVRCCEIVLGVCHRACDSRLSTTRH